MRAARRLGPFESRIDADLVRRFAAATSDPAPDVGAGSVVPATMLATAIWPAQEATRSATVPDEVQRSAAGGVHGEHDVVVHRPIVPGDRLHTWVEPHGVRPAGRNAAVTAHYSTFDADDTLIAEQWWTTVYLGAMCDADGQPAPDHAFPDAARARRIGVQEIEVDSDMARRYAEVSGDWSAHHFDADAARASGSDRPFLHGLCTMALCAQAVVALAAVGEADRLRRIAVRFALPMPLGKRLEVSVYDAGPLGLAFEASCDGTAVVTNGRATVR